jgi:hypothetical protein
MTFLQKLKIKIGSNLIASATDRWHPKYPPEAYFHGEKSFSQCGEDLAAINILMQLGHEGPVHYVDIGCFHPIQYSNTYFYYLRGGSGLVVDMNESHRAEFQRLRPRDKFISELISDTTQKMRVRSKGSPTDSIISRESNEIGEFRQPRSLSFILDEFWPKNERISLLDIDCEGHDLEVLRSNNWDKYRPKVIILEDFLYDEFSPIKNFMMHVNYKVIARLRCALLLVENLQ